MSIGILIHNMILLLICLIFFRTVPVIAGVLIGAAAAEVLLISIARSTELCVESADGAYSSKKMVIHSLIRSLCVEYIREDEYVEVTPKNMRMRKIELDHLKRKRSNKD